MAAGPEAAQVLRLVRDALATPALRRLQLAWTLSSIGAWAFTVVLAVHAFEAGGAGAVALAAAARTLPAAIAAPFTGLLGDRYARRTVLVWLTVARVLVLAAAAAAIAAALPLGAVLVLAGAFTALSTGHKPAQAGMLLTLAGTPSRLAAANALWSGLDNAGFLLGSLLAGVLVAVTGADVGMGVTAAAFAAAALALLAVPHDPVPAHRDRTGGGAIGYELLLGARAAVRDPGLRTVLGVSAVTTAVQGAADVLVVVLAIDVLGLGEPGVGWLSAAWGAGGLVGGIAVLALLGRGQLARGIVVGGLLAGLPLVALGAEPVLWAVLAGLAVLGVGSAFIETGVLTFVQRLSSDEVLARVFAVQELGLQLTTALGALLAPVLVAELGIRGALVAVGAVLPVLVLARRRTLARLETGVPVPARELGLVRAHQAFAPLPLAIQETLALALEPMHAAPGEVVVRQGEPGERFYLIAGGEAVAEVDGARRRSMGAGEGFGEIALLRDVPRTATVRATTALELRALDRVAFLGAVTGTPRTLAAADRIVAEREPSLGS